MRIETLNQKAQMFCPLRVDEGRNQGRRLGLEQPADAIAVPRPDRWSLASEMVRSIPRAEAFQTPGLAVHMAVNHHRIARQLPWGLWDPLRLYQLAQQREMELGDGDEADENDLPAIPLVTLQSVLEAARFDGLGEIITPYDDDEPIPSAISELYRLRSMAEIENAIRFYGPVIIAFDWFNSFKDPCYATLNGIIHTPAEVQFDDTAKPIGRGCMVAYGYESRRLRLKCRTTIGPQYGRGGDVDITYPEIERQISLSHFDAWLLLVEGE